MNILNKMKRTTYLYATFGALIGGLMFGTVVGAYGKSELGQALLSIGGMTLYFFGICVVPTLLGAYLANRFFLPMWFKPEAKHKPLAGIYTALITVTIGALGVAIGVHVYDVLCHFISHGLDIPHALRKFSKIPIYSLVAVGYSLLWGCPAIIILGFLYGRKAEHLLKTKI